METPTQAQALRSSLDELIAIEAAKGRVLLAFAAALVVVGVTMIGVSLWNRALVAERFDAVERDHTNLVCYVATASDGVPPAVCGEPRP